MLRISINVTILALFHLFLLQLFLIGFPSMFIFLFRFYKPIFNSLFPFYSNIFILGLPFFSQILFFLFLYLGMIILNHFHFESWGKLFLFLLQTSNLVQQYILSYPSPNNITYFFLPPFCLKFSPLSYVRLTHNGLPFLWNPFPLQSKSFSLL